MSSEIEKIEKSEAENRELKVFLIEVLTDLTVLKNNIYHMQIFDAYRNVQKISDKIKDKVGKI